MLLDRKVSRQKPKKSNKLRNYIKNIIHHKLSIRLGVEENEHQFLNGE